MNLQLQLLAVVVVAFHATAQIDRPNYDETGRRLPPGVPKVVDTNGNTIFVEDSFTTRAYHDAAFKLVLEEANRVAKDLNMTNELPVAETNLVESYINPFGFAYAFKMIGNVSTRNYSYYVSQGNKFSDLGTVNYDQVCLELRKKTIPVKLMDTNAAYQFATQSLASVKMDVAALNRDCKVHVAVSPYWNGLSHLGDQPKKQFAPIYYIWWTSPQNEAEKSGSTAYVELFLPTKKLIQLSVEDQKYILRPPIVFTNLAALFPGIAPVITNYPTKSILIDRGHR